MSRGSNWEHAAIGRQQPERAGADAGRGGRGGGGRRAVRDLRRTQRRCVSADGQTRRAMPMPCTRRAAGTRRRRLSRGRGNAGRATSPSTRCCIRWGASCIATCFSPPPSAPPGDACSIHPSIPQPSSLPESCRAVSQRAARTLKWAEELNQSLLDIALDHLTLGRAALYAAILEALALDQLDACREPLQHAVDGLRRAGDKITFPVGLLTRAWLRFLTGARPAPRARIATSMRPLKSPSAGRCRCLWRTFICIGRGCLD